MLLLDRTVEAAAAEEVARGGRDQSGRIGARAGEAGATRVVPQCERDARCHRCAMQLCETTSQLSAATRRRSGDHAAAAGRAREAGEYINTSVQAQEGLQALYEAVDTLNDKQFCAIDAGRQSRIVRKLAQAVTDLRGRLSEGHAGFHPHRGR